MMCLLCQQPLHDELNLLQALGVMTLDNAVICEPCRQQFQSITTACAGCGRQQADDTLCQDCRRWQQQGQQLLAHCALYQYNEAMRQYMKAYKFNGDYLLRTVFNRELIQKVHTMAMDMVVPVPVSHDTMLRRGFNQTLGLFEGVPYQALLQVTQQQKAHQSQRDRAACLHRKQPFSIVVTKDLVDQRVLLVDDVYTTGNTLYHAATLLYQLGAKEVKSLSLAR